MSALYCRTIDLAELLPKEESIYDMEKQTGISARVFHKIRAKETWQTKEETADTILTALGLTHLYYLLEFGPQESSPHGAGGYTKGCRCNICKLAKKARAKRYRAKLKAKKEAEKND